LLFYCSLLPAVQAEPIRYQEMRLSIQHQVQFDIDWAPDARLTSMELNSYFYPQNWSGQQKVLLFETSHPVYAIEQEGGIQYISYQFDEQTLRPRNEVRSSTELLSWPYRPALNQIESWHPADAGRADLPFLRHAGQVDTTPGLAELALKIAGNSRDRLSVAVALANWIEDNIDYDLVSIQSPARKTAVETWQTGKGVCQEMTNLYISMMRTLGIPARAVYGYASTNSRELRRYFKSEWATHAWAEIMLGGQWIPADLTYHQIGYVDASHVVLAKSPEIRTRVMQAKLIASGMALEKGGHETIIKTLSRKEARDDEGSGLVLTASAELTDPEHGLFRLRIENTTQDYRVVRPVVSKAEEVRWLDEPGHYEILPPAGVLQKEYRFSLVDLRPGYRYTFPFEAVAGGINEQFNLEVIRR
jgi:hypothetical protein